LEIPSVNSEHKSHLKKKTGKTLKYKKRVKLLKANDNRLNVMSIKVNLHMGCVSSISLQEGH